MRNAPSRIAMALLPGMPKATVGMRLPPSRELVGRAGPQDAAYVALAEAALVLGRLHRVAVGQPLRDAAAQTRQGADERAR